jgi:hypothetical protein
MMVSVVSMTSMVSRSLRGGPEERCHQDRGSEHQSFHDLSSKSAGETVDPISFLSPVQFGGHIYLNVALAESAAELKGTKTGIAAGLIFRVEDLSQSSCRWIGSNC